MRDQGRLVDWNDEKGFGFIQPNDSTKGHVFLHIKDFARPGPRPIVGCALEYVIQMDGHGRYRAKQVTYLTASQAKTKKSVPAKQNNKTGSSKLTTMQMVSVAYIVTLAVFTVLGILSGMVLLFISIINVLTYWFYAQDKEAAQLGNRRIPENTLHLLSFLGGWPTAWFAQQKLRHKTQKQPFRKIYFCTIAFNILLILWLISPANTWI
jgi:uncharacterized membrane protein YsdA (DUF1294 family)/cold shock CspA family protein